MNLPMGSEVIHIACQADHRFAPDCAVMLHSMLTVNAGERFEIHFLHHPQLPAEDLERLAGIATRFGARWSPQPIPDEQMAEAGFPYNAHFGGYAACYRLLLAQLLPDLPRVLYLDADTLHVDRLRPLWDMPLDGKCLGAVTNPLFEHMEARIKESLGMPDAREYFNSGVLLFDLKQMRATGMDKELLRFIRERRIPIPWPDQDSLNVVLWRHRLPLHPRWNTLTGIYELSHRFMPWDRGMLQEARDNPAILHFVGAYKPRHYRFQHPYRERYFEHLRQTAWRNLPIEGGTLFHRLMRPLPVLLQWRLEALFRKLERQWQRLRAGSKGK